MSDAPVIRIVKKKYAHASHHGGSWKVAYADFVTAMMAFFLVMWIISMDQNVREQIQNYFNDPASASNSPAGISRLAAGGRSAISTGLGGIMNERSWRQSAREAQRQRFVGVKQLLEKAIARRLDLARLAQHVRISVTASGLLIELVETKGATFFESSSARLPEATRRLLELIARELGRLPNSVVVEGHTDPVPYRAGSEYTNWELSADRANAARRVLTARGLRPGQVIEVRGYADSRPREGHSPDSAANRRVSIVVNYEDPASATTSRTQENGRPSLFPVDVKPESLPALTAGHAQTAVVKE
jgi:chemotaxis protein MotB